MPEVALTELWLPILLAAAAVFVVSSLIHVASPLHKSDYKPLPDEERVLEAMREAGLQRGGYAFPFASSMKEMAEEGFISKQNQGPVGFMQVLPNGPIKMGGALVIWFLYSALLATFAGYIGTLCLSRGADYHEVFRITGTVALLGFATAPIQDSIWRGVRWAVTARFVAGGILYGLVTAGVFGAMWPGV